MDDFGGFIYVIVTIIAIAFSVLRKANQNKTQQNKPFSPNRDNQTGFPNFETLFESDEEEDEEDVFEKSAPVVAEPVMVKNDFLEKKKQIERNFSSIQRKAKVDNESIINVEEEKSGNRWFNAKEAIIFSEILKRPDY